ncbi:MAG: helix-turn-helix transcriptional regulator [Bacillaceae bacterium]
MNKQEIISILSEKMKLVRTEAGYTQEKMAEIIGLSKKTLVGIEKGRFNASWTTTVAFVTLFSHSTIIQNILGDEPIQTIQALAHSELYTPKEKTLGGHIWWKEIKSTNNFRLQQNVVSNHYRILDSKNYRWFSTFDYDHAQEYFTKLTK